MAQHIGLQKVQWMIDSTLLPMHVGVNVQKLAASIQQKRGTLRTSGNRMLSDGDN